MTTAEQLVFSISTEGRSIHALLWDDKGDLVRALVTLCAGLRETPMHAQYVSDADKDVVELRALVESRISVYDDDCYLDRKSIAERLWILFIQQASSATVGPWLNGWRRPISEPPGAVLVIRRADFDSFQRNAPDIASFIGPRVFDASTMLSVFSKQVYDHLNERLPKEIEGIMERLPGAAPAAQEVRDWIQANKPDDRQGD